MKSFYDSDLATCLGICVVLIGVGGCSYLCSLSERPACRCPALSAVELPNSRPVGGPGLQPIGHVPSRGEEGPQ